MSRATAKQIYYLAKYLICKYVHDTILLSHLRKKQEVKTVIAEHDWHLRLQVGQVVQSLGAGIKMVREVKTKIKKRPAILGSQAGREGSCSSGLDGSFPG